ncbi:MAG: UDP-N-acetylmuramoyl-tripeptide--D-alanyl-D-alanine ligase [Bryobacterales bacterium]|nr:UDP-N-acetylmuramoyl-tripeptide--D-alanyl-D-alanine ligase [Bryobacteraceae bacterium]MDW8356029.1 UDP-N-acetylmuramoyl-tripeptide--D-alanyl-D-alanine ligase [Bryobacterales bacterium]
MKLSLAQVACALGADPPRADTLISGWSTDSRSVEPGDAFFALRGSRHDGHDFVAEAFARGAAVAIVEREVGVGTLVRVPDTLAALQRLAAWARRRWGGRVIAVTGSAGKTTTKEAIARLLETALPTGKSAGNWNNHIGVPLSILRLPDECEVAVLELAMNHAGEIRHLARIARPDIGVVTMVGWAHIENFGSIEEIALAKRELVEELGPSGVAVLNADDPRVAAFRQVHSGRSVTFGFSEAADVRATEVQLGVDGTRFRCGGVEFETQLAGRHGVRNILAALAVAHVVGLPFETLRDAVRSLQAPPMRGERFEHRGVTVINDCYNANPDAVGAMLDVLRSVPGGRRWAVLGEMAELGEWSERLHREVGRLVAEAGIDLLVGIRGAARYLVEEAVRSGLPDRAAFFFQEPEPAGEFLRAQVRAGDVVLFKGSRATRVEAALEKFLQ